MSQERWWSAWVWRRYLLVRVYLGWHAVVAFGFGVELIVVPRRFVSGPSTTEIYSALDPPTWGLMFLLLALLCAVGARWPLRCWRFAILALGVAQIAWAIGLSVPLFTSDHANVLAPTAWIALAVTTGLVALETIREELRGGSGGRG